MGSGERRRRNEPPFQRISIAKKEENRPISGKISLFPNTINNFMMAIVVSDVASLSTAPFGTHATMNTTTRQDSNRNGVINEDELIDDLSLPWNQAQSNCRPPITLGSLRIHSHRRRLDAVVIVTRKE